MKNIRPAIAFVICLALAAGIAGVPPAPAYGGGDEILLEFIVQNNDVSSTSSAIVPFDPSSPDRACVVSVPAITSGSIEFPSMINGVTVSAIEYIDGQMPSDTMPDASLTISGLTFSFTAPFERIALAVHLENQPPMNFYRFTFYQPGFDMAELSFALENVTGIGEGTTFGPVTVDMSVVRPPALDATFELPTGVSSASITTSGILTGPGVTEVMTPFELSGAPIEYVVDRSDYVRSDDGAVSLDRYFGMVRIHYFFMVGYSTESVQIVFHEPDFVGLQVEPERKAGDWGSGVLDFSEEAMQNTELTPTANIYFTNESFMLGPQDFGVPATITGITCSSSPDVTATSSGVSFPWEGFWEITLPNNSLDPEFRFDVTLDDGGENDRTVQLLVRRVLTLATSYDMTERTEPDEDGKFWTTYWTEIEPITGTNDYGDFQTFVTVFAYEDHEDGNTTFPIDHRLLVMYYQDTDSDNDGDIDVRRILGARQQSVESNLGAEDPMDYSDRHEVLVFREGDPQYADVADVNRITAFVITNAGISAEADSFGGVTFGLGAGWSHLLPNHPDWGSGKDGMEYERPVN